LTQTQLDAAELAVRREIAQRRFAAEELRILKFFVERSFPLGRAAAFFRSFQHLAIVSGFKWRSHAHEAFKSLLNKRVLVKYHPNWYGVNVFFLEWSEDTVLARVETFDEEPDLYREPLLKELITEAFINAAGEKILSGQTRDTIANQTTDRGRDAGPAPSSETDIRPGESISPRASSDQKHSDKITQDHYRRLTKAIQEGRVEEEFPEFTQAMNELPPTRTIVPWTGGVPQKGTLAEKGTFPAENCSPKRNSSETNKDAPSPDFLREKGTSIASLASCTEEAELARGVPKKGTRQDRSAEAWRWLQEIDSTQGLRVDRFAKAWQITCERDPDYVLNVLPKVLARQEKRDGRVDKPLALLARAAREDGRLR
jgi:hypothetical protein